MASDQTPERSPCPAVEHMSESANYEGLERRVCPECRLYFDVGEDSETVYCSRACKRRHTRGDDGGS